MQKSIFLLLFLIIGIQLPAQVPSKDSLLTVILHGKDDTGKVIAYRIITGITVPSDPLLAIEYGKIGIVLGKKLAFSKGIAGCMLNVGYAYSAAGQLDNALIYTDSAIDWSKKVGEPTRLALAYLNRADYNRQLVRMKHALKDCDTALVYAEKANKDDTRARIFQTFGSIFHAQEDFVKSRQYYERANALYEKLNNTQMMAISFNNLGNVYKQEKQYEQAVANYNNAINLAEKVGDKNNMSMLYNNRSNVYYEMKQYKEAESSALLSIEHARLQKNILQLADAQYQYARVLLKMNRINEAIKQGNESYGLATGEAASESQEGVAEVLAEGYYRTGNYQEAYKYMEVSKKIADTLARQRFDDEVAALQTNMQFSEKNKEIELLNKDSDLQKQQLKDQRIIMIAAGIIVILSLLGIWLTVNRNRLKQRMKALELRNQIAADLHDEVGSSLSSIHMLSQMAFQPGNEARQKDILQKMSRNTKETMDKMGDIVWMIKPDETKGDSLQQRMEKFAYEIGNAKNIKVISDINDLQKINWSLDQTKNIYLIFKEALNNAAKYSDSETIHVFAGMHHNKFILQVKDFGKGFDINSIQKGNGLNNMQQRAVALGGIIEFNIIEPQGSDVVLTIPV
ncbi:MAG: tetratricopeptide repeat protein [Rhizobacter sp.]|nr:tetratricopeptide repeat protein [Ferruginibacter sp.]